MKHYVYFPIREFTTSTQKAIDEINRLASDPKKSFSLFFDPKDSKRIRIRSCKGVIPRASFLLTERNFSIEDRVMVFNQLLTKDPIVLAVGVSDIICITIVVDD